MKKRGLTNAQRENLTDEDVDEIRMYFKSISELHSVKWNAKISNGATLEYRKDPTIENYIKIRRASPDELVDINRHPGADFYDYGREELEAIGIDWDAYLGLVFGDGNDISKICLILLEKICERKKLEKSGEKHLPSRGLAISDSLIDFLIWGALEASINCGMQIPRDLFVLIRERLGTAASNQMKADLHGKRKNAVEVAVMLILEDKQPTMRSIGKILGVAHTTVADWFRGESLEGHLRAYVSQAVFFNKHLPLFKKLRNRRIGAP